MKILIIIPAYNEEDSILSVFNSIQEYNKSSEIKCDVIVINDCSTDRTAKILDEAKIPHIDLVHNLGIGGAVQTGYKYAYSNKYDIAVQFDGDGQHDVNYILNIITPILCNDADFVIGSRFVDSTTSEFKSSASRRMGIQLISSIIKLTTGKRVLDTTSGFRAINKELIGYFADRYPIEYPEPISTTDLLCQGFVVSEIPVKMYERSSGESSIKAWKSVYYMINVILTIFAITLRRRQHAK